jgi:hypothetical protein
MGYSNRQSLGKHTIEIAEDGASNTSSDDVSFAWPKGCNGELIPGSEDWTYCQPRGAVHKDGEVRGRGSTRIVFKDGCACQAGWRYDSKATGYDFFAGYCGIQCKEVAGSEPDVVVDTIDTTPRLNPSSLRSVREYVLWANQRTPTITLKTQPQTIIEEYARDGHEWNKVLLEGDRTIEVVMDGQVQHVQLMPRVEKLIRTLVQLPSYNNGTVVRAGHGWFPGIPTMGQEPVEGVTYEVRQFLSTSKSERASSKEIHIKTSSQGSFFKDISDNREDQGQMHEVLGVLGVRLRFDGMDGSAYIYTEVGTVSG